ncbi:MAG: hypothetical protein H6817_04505 [Phycisphaerales bacterium]|nr:hypothetical protein [Phycisphaerales bacterium]
MIIAACTVNVDPHSRSRSIASVINAIACAGANEPAPDLIVLPDCYVDTPGGPAAPSVTPAMCIGFRETISRAAREWGVWIAVGHARILRDGMVPGASVFDPDGDAWLRYPPGQTSSKEIDAGAWSVRPTPLGFWALCRGAMHGDDEPISLPTNADLAIIPASPSTAGYSLDDFSDAAKRSNCALCLARAQLDGDASVSDGANVAIIARDGEVLASAPGGVVVAEVEVPRCAPEIYLEDLEHVE